MYSFYGGRPGNSFVIVTTFGDIQTMVNNFQQGPNYTEVHFDQYVMINTPNKNDPDNGKIFRRGYNFNNNMGGAQYIGCIAGPSGNAPILHLTTIAEAQSKYNEEDPSGQWEKRQTSGSYNVNTSLIPGRNEDGTFNNSINWYCCSIVSQDGETSQAYVGFTFPYLIIDIDSESVDPYNDSGLYYDNAAIEKDEDEQSEHPFYEKFHLKIPKGVKGDSIKNLKVEIASNEIQDYDGQDEDVANNKPVLVYEYYDYSQRQDGYSDNESNRPKKIYLGDYNMINNISIEDNGNVIIDYTHNNSQTFENVFKTITSATLNEENGNFTILYNFGQSYETQLNWVKDISINDNGSITIDYTKDPSRTYENKIKWIDQINLESDGTLNVKYNNNNNFTPLQNKIKWITSTSLNEQTGVISLNYNDDTSTPLNIKWIKEVAITNDGIMEVRYNTGDPNTFSMKWISNVSLTDDGSLYVNYYNQSGGQRIGQIPWITNAYTDIESGQIKLSWNNRSEDQVLTNLKLINNVSINTEDTNNSGQGSGDQKLAITWNDGSSTEIGNPINYIMETAINDDHHLLVRYSDPQRRANGVTWDGKTGWTDLGTVLISSISGGEAFQNLRWNGIGKIVTSGIANAPKYLSFVVVPIQPVEESVTEINMTGQLHAVISGETNPLDININLNNTTVTKTLTGLQFLVNTGLTADGTAASDQYADIIITNLYLEFLAT